MCVYKLSDLEKLNFFSNLTKPFFFNYFRNRIIVNIVYNICGMLAIIKINTFFMSDMFILLNTQSTFDKLLVNEMSCLYINS